MREQVQGVVHLRRPSGREPGVRSLCGLARYWPEARWSPSNDARRWVFNPASVSCVHCLRVLPGVSFPPPAVRRCRECIGLPCREGVSECDCHDGWEEEHGPE